MRYLLLILLVFSITACTSTYPLNMSPQQVQEKVNVNELDLINKTLVLTLQNGRRHTVKVKQVTDESIIGNGVEYLFKDIIAIEAKKVSAGNTLLGAAGALGTYTLVWYGLLAIGVIEIF